MKRESHFLVALFFCVDGLSLHLVHALLHFDLCGCLNVLSVQVIIQYHHVLRRFAVLLFVCCDDILHRLVKLFHVAHFINGQIIEQFCHSRLLCSATSSCG